MAVIATAQLIRQPGIAITILQLPRPRRERWPAVSRRRCPCDGARLAAKTDAEHCVSEQAREEPETVGVSAVEAEEIALIFREQGCQRTPCQGLAKGWRRTQRTGPEPLPARSAEPGSMGFFLPPHSASILRNFRKTARKSSGSTGLTRCRSIPASAERRRSSSLPCPVIAMSKGRLSAFCSCRRFAT